jgi:hypothetical protein
MCKKGRWMSNSKIFLLALLCTAIFFSIDAADRPPTPCPSEKTERDLTSEEKTRRLQTLWEEKVRQDAVQNGREEESATLTRKASDAALRAKPHSPVGKVMHSGRPIAEALFLGCAKKQRDKEDTESDEEAEAEENNDNLKVRDGVAPLPAKPLLKVNRVAAWTSLRGGLVAGLEQPTSIN